MATDDSVHNGHRQRMRERIEKGGIDCLQAHELLEYLLYAYIPRRDTNAVAHELINKFGDLAGVLNASKEHLAQVKGMTANAALFLSTLPEVFRAYIASLNSPKQQLKGKGAVRVFMGNKLYGAKDERAIIAALDAHENLISCDRLGEGSGDSVGLSVRAVVNYALRVKASSVIIAHNHPSGSVSPSQADADFTFQALMTLNNVGVRLADHFIFCGSDYFSFEENGNLERMKNAKNYLKEGMYFYD